ncbi:MAG: FAD-dependent oxidoreductase [Pseudomonadota bacterium]
MTKKSIVVVGGGYLGSQLASSLDEFLDVTLVEPMESFVHAPAMLRSLVDPRLLDAALFPYEKLLKHGRIVTEHATKLDKSGITLASGDHLSADYYVVATGSSNGFAFKPDKGDLESFLKAQAELAKSIANAKSIAIVGAGAVGTELAGEIAHARPEKKITLISADTRLFPSMPAKLGGSLANKLTDLGVELRFGTRAENLASLTEPSSGTLQLGNGDQITADLIIPAIGSKPQTALLSDLPGTRMGTSNRFSVDAYLRPSDLDNVFAAGDAVDAGDAMTIVAISRQQPWLTKTLKALAEGKSLTSQKKYTPWGNAPILVPIGPRRGNSYLGFATVGDWITRSMKGRDLFITKYRKLLRQ